MMDDGINQSERENKKFGFLESRTSGCDSSRKRTESSECIGGY